MATKYFIMIVMFAVTFFVGTVIIFLQNYSPRFDKGKLYFFEKIKREKVTLKKSGVFINKLFVFFDKFPLTSYVTKKIVLRIDKSGGFPKEDRQKYSVFGIILGIIIILIFSLLGSFIFTDLINKIILIAFGIAISNALFDRFLAQRHYEMLIASKAYLYSVGEEFNYKHSVSEAVKVWAKDILRDEISDIQEIIDGDNAMAKLMNYFSKSPIRVLQTFAGISLLTSEKGDVIKDGLSTYRTLIQSLVSELSREIERINYTKMVYGFNSIIPILSIFSGLLFSKGVLGMMPGLSLMLKGSYGYISNILINVVALIVFIEIEKATKDNFINQNDVPKITRRLINKIPNSVISIIIPQNKKKEKKINIAIEKARSRHTIKSFRVTRVLYALIAFIVAVMILLLSNVYGLDYLTKTLDGSDGGKLEPDQQVLLKEIDDQFIAYGNMTEEELYNQLKNQLNLKDNEINVQIERIAKKQEAINHAGFDVMELWIAIIVAVVVSMQPNFMLFIRKKLVKAEIEEDVMQMQTMITILMQTSLDTIDLLRWLANTSRIHKNILIEAWINFAYNPEFALDYMASKTENMDFKYICQKLKSTIEKSSIAETFQELILEKEHIIRVRTEKQTVAINQKSTILMFVCFIPLLISMMLLILFPMGVFVVGNMDFILGMG